MKKVKFVDKDGTTSLRPVEKMAEVLYEPKPPTIQQLSAIINRTSEIKYDDIPFPEVRVYKLTKNSEGYFYSEA